MSGQASFDHISPRHGTTTFLDSITLPGNTALNHYQRVSFESAISGPFSAASDASLITATGIITQLGDQVTLYMNTLNFTATAAASSPAPLALTTAVPAVFRPETGTLTASSSFLGGTGANAVQPVSVRVTGAGVVSFVPHLPVSTGGFCTTDGAVTFPSCSVSWPINLPVY